jgi:ribosomal protein S15
LQQLRGNIDPKDEGNHGISPLSHSISVSEFKDTLERSFALSTPPVNVSSNETPYQTPLEHASWEEFAPRTKQEESETNATENHVKAHERATQAMERILSMNNAGAKDWNRQVVERCIAKFGRHNTDSTLPPKPRSADAPEEEAAVKKRAGPDTGSSEVQIAVLTTKIRNLAETLEGRGRMDKHNKRNLQLMIHKRQRLLQYFRKKERGGPRWQHLMENLGLTDAAWKGEITM